jgi:putative transposase
MFRISRFQQLMKPLSNGVFEALVRQHGANKHDKKFSRWDQLLAMVFGQLSGASSLRQLEAGFNSQRLHHYHLGSRALHRSTLADANNKGKVQVFEEGARVLISARFDQLHAQGSGLRCVDSRYVHASHPGIEAAPAL